MPTGLLAATPNARQPERKTCEVWETRFPQSKTTVDTKLCMNGPLEKYKMVQVCTGHTTQHPTWRCSFRCMLDQLINMKRWQRKKDMKVPFPFDRSALSNSRPQNSAPQFVSMRLSLSPPSTSPHKKTRIRWPDVFIPRYCFVEMWIFPYIANSMILWSAMFCI